MKRCPACHREYDDTAAHCEIDGTALEASDAAPNNQKTTQPQPLADFIKQHAPLTIERATRVAIAICQAVEELERAGRIVSALHPRTITIDARGQTDKITLRKAPAEQPTSGDEQLPDDSAVYLSPEAAQQQPTNAASAVYSIGAMLYEMLTGQPPFTAATAAAIRIKHILEPPPPPINLRPEIPLRLQEITLRALEKVSAARPPSPAQLQRELEAARAELREAAPAYSETTGALIEQESPLMDGLADLEPRVESAPTEQSFALGDRTPLAPSATQEVACPNCQTMNDAGWAFCQQCGNLLLQQLRTPQSEPPSSPQGFKTVPTERPLVEKSLKTVIAERIPSSPVTMPEPPPNPLPSSLQTMANEPPIVPEQKPAVPPPGYRPPPRTEQVESYQSQSRADGAICPKCNHPNQAGSAFCAACGNILTVAQTFIMASPYAAAAKGKLHLVMEGGQAGETYELGDETVIGRASGDMIFPHDGFMSGRHARIERRGTVFVLIDEGSRNGTFIKIKDEVELQSSDMMLIGKQLFRAEIQSSAPASTSANEVLTIARPKPPTPAPIDPTPAPKPSSIYDLQTVYAEKQCPKCGSRFRVTDEFCVFDGERLQKAPPLPEPDPSPEEIEPFTIAQYRCFARLGEGGMGVVYKARHLHLDRISAVKVLLPETVHLPEAVSRFRREAQIASSINHPNSVVIYDYGEAAASLFYLAMEFIPGKSLAAILKPKHQPPQHLPLARVLSITRQICDVLDAAHQVGIIHRDLKPHNVMICERVGKTDLVKVVDFGLARSLGGRSDSLPGTLVGTPAFMSPEQARTEMNLDARTDIFSLALMVYQMLSGTLPFPAEGLDMWSQVMRRAVLVEPPPPLSFLRPELRIPAEVDAALALALAPNRNERTPAASLFIEQLEQAARR